MRTGFSRPSQMFGRGMTLIETSLVMLVCATILVGIWTAMAPANDKTKINQAKEDIRLIVQNTRNLYSGRSLTATGTCSTKTGLKTMGTDVFPGDMVNGSYVNNKWNQGEASTSAIVYICEKDPVKMIVRFTNVPAKACIDLLMSTPTEFAGDVLQINVNSDSTAVTTGSVVDLETASTKCGSGGTIDWYFKVSG